MTKEELFALITKAGLIPVPVIQDTGTERTFNYFDGKLEGFLAAARAIGSTAVFVQDSPLEPWLFLYNPDDEGDDDEEGDPENEIDLSKVSPELANYKKHLGQNYSFHLTAKGGAADLCLIIDQPWFADFENEVERAQGAAILSRRQHRKN